MRLRWDMCLMRVTVTTKFFKKNLLQMLVLKNKS